MKHFFLLLLVLAQFRVEVIIFFFPLFILVLGFLCVLAVLQLVLLSHLILKIPSIVVAVFVFRVEILNVLFFLKIFCSLQS